MLIVAEPTRRSLGTARQIQLLAQDIGLNRLWLVGNKIQNPDELDFLQTQSPELPLLGWLSMDAGVQEADQLGTAVYDQAPVLRRAADEIGSRLLRSSDGSRG
jgi:CO dehydrogenase maturation factor